MARIEDDRSRTICDLPGCDAVKPSWSTWQGGGSFEWYGVETGNGRTLLDFCSREHLVEALMRGMTAADLAEQGRRLASEREDLIASGVDPADLLVPSVALTTPETPNIERLRDDYIAATLTLQQAIADQLCPGPHVLVQRADGRLPWCEACDLALDATDVNEETK